TNSYRKQQKIPRTRKTARFISSVIKPQNVAPRLFRQLSSASSKQCPDVRRQLASGELIHRKTTSSGQRSLSGFIHCHHGSPDFRKITERRKRFCRRATLGKRRWQFRRTSTGTV